MISDRLSLFTRQLISRSTQEHGCCFETVLVKRYRLELSDILVPIIDSSQRIRRYQTIGSCTEYTTRPIISYHRLFSRITDENILDY